jgi:2-polyprenyl-3-methyl-5-hydroxy-6-metoxy-1,4-benzoquinol methylase
LQRAQIQSRYETIFRHTAVTRITADQERQFYDQSYAPLLALPDEALVWNRDRLVADLDNPAQAVYERRRMYRTVMELLLTCPVSGLKVLDYGCGTGDWGLLLATEGAQVTMLDLSPVAIELAVRRARVNGVGDRVRGIARNASDLTCFADAEFDLIYASAAIHHTLKYPHALTELVRVLKPEGRLILAETYGNNRLLNLARRLRWRISREPVEAGEEIIFSDREVAVLRRHFRRVDMRPMNCLAMVKRLFRGHFGSPAARWLVGILEAADAVLLRTFPFLRRYCGEVVVISEK